MNAINRFLVNQNVDVGRSLGLLTLSSTVGSVFGVLGAWMTGHPTFDLSVPLGLIVGIALWLHVSWARQLVILGVWLGVSAAAGLLVLIPFTGTGKLTLTMGNLVIQHPPLWQPYVLAVFAAPWVWLILAVLHSDKARTEFQAPVPARAISFNQAAR